MIPSMLGGVAVLLIYGPSDTAYDVGVLRRALRNTDAITHVPTLPDHGMRPEDLIHIPAEAWLETLTQAYERLATERDTVHTTGMYMGAPLALVLVYRTRHDITRPQNRLASFVVPVHIDGWSTPWYRDLRYAVYRVLGMAAYMHVEEDEPFGIKNPSLWRVIKTKLARGDSFHYSWVPLACIRQVDRLWRWAPAGTPDTQRQTLVIHSRKDELTSLRSAQTLQATLPHTYSVVLENSYHMTCVDNDRDQVVAEVLGFFGLDPVAARCKGPTTAD